MHPLNWFRGHSRWHALMDRAIDGDLSSADEARLHAHLDTCRACAERYAEHGALRRAFTAALPAAAPPRSFAITPEMVAAYKPAPAAAPRRPLRAAMALQGVGMAAAVAAIGVIALDMTMDAGSGSDQYAADDAYTTSIEMASGESDGGGAAGTSEMAPRPEAAGEVPDAGSGPETMAGDAPVTDDADDARQGADPEQLEQSGEVTAIALEEPGDDDGRSGLAIAAIILGAVAAITLTSGLAMRIGLGRGTR